MPPLPRRDERAALVIGHPGHELYVYGWLGRARPRVHVLTDGSGIDRRPRLERTRQILERRGAQPGAVFGVLADRRVYDALLDGEVDLFVRMLPELAKALVEDEVTMVVGDSAEGFNPTHDLCRLLIQAACELAARQLGRPVASYRFAQFLPPPARDAAPAGTRWLDLDDALFAEKRDIAERHDDLEAEVADALGRIGASAFRSECLIPSEVPAGHYALPDPPVYERFAEALQRQGRVERVIRYRQHVLPVAEALGRAVRVA